MSIKHTPSFTEEASSVIIQEDLYQGTSRGVRKGVYLSAVVAAIGGYLSGFDTGATSGVLTMQPFTSYFFTEGNIEYLEGLLLALFLMTAAIASFLSGIICDRLSRKYAIMLATGIFCIGNLFLAIGHNFGLFLTGRLVAGFGAGLMTSGIPLYHSEIAPPDIRGRLISFFTLMGAFGQVSGYFVTFGTSYLTSNWSWRAPYVMQCLMASVFGVCLVPMPFSPRWLVDHGRTEEARSSLVLLRGVPANHPIVADELQAIVDEIDFERSLGKRTYRELFEAQNRKQLVSASFIAVATAFTGIVSIWYYAPMMIQSAGLSDTSVSIATTGGSGLLSLVMSALSLQWAIDQLGRKKLFLFGAAGMGISMFIIGGLFQTYTEVDAETGNVTIHNVPARNTIVAFVYIFCAIYSFTWGIATYVYPAEVFNMRVRAKGLAFAYGLNWGFTILISYCVPLFLLRTVSGVYFFFGACCIVTMGGVFFLPETKGRTLEEMDSVFRTPSSSVSGK
ncbi:general substrate transporter [Dichotomocladium elegans]|nr:general substrate transporter [Dichotomocladium elegans]